MDKKNNDLISWLQEWYYQNCNGDWEHNQNVLITTIDNPGWSMTITLEDTYLESKHFNKIFIENDDLNWFSCRVEEKKFLADCGPYNLLDVLAIFKNFANCSSGEII